MVPPKLSFPNVMDSVNFVRGLNCFRTTSINRPPRQRSWPTQIKAERVGPRVGSPSKDPHHSYLFWRHSLPSVEMYQKNFRDE